MSPPNADDVHNYCRNDDMRRQSRVTNKAPIPVHVRALLVLPPDNDNGFAESLVVGRLHGRSEPDVAELNLSIAAETIPAFDSYMEVKMMIHWKDETGTRDSSAATYRFNKYALDHTNPCVAKKGTQHSEEEAKAAEEQFSISQDEELKSLYDNGEMVFGSMVVKNPSEVLPVNGRNRNEYGEQTALVRRIDRYLTSTESINFVVNGDAFELRVEQVAADIKAMVKNNPLRDWFPKGDKPGKPFYFQTGRMPTIEDGRPEIWMPPAITFHNHDHYQLVQGYAALQEYEHIAKKASPVDDIPATVIALNGYANRKYLLIAQVDLAETPFEAGDKLSVSFPRREDISDEDDDETADTNDDKLAGDVPDGAAVEDDVPNDDVTQINTEELQNASEITDHVDGVHAETDGKSDDNMPESNDEAKDNDEQTANVTETSEQAKDAQAWANDKNENPDQEIPAPRSITSERWHGQVIQNLTVQGLSSIAIVINRPVDEEKPHDFIDDLSTEPKPVAMVKDWHTDLEARRDLIDKPKVKVGLYPRSTNKAFRRAIMNMSIIFENESGEYHNIQGLLLGKNLNGLALRNAFANFSAVKGTVPEAIEWAMNRYSLNDGQRAGVKKLHDLIGGAITLSGPPGVGKTLLTRAVVCALQVMEHKETEMRPKVLFVCPMNQGVDRYAADIATDLSDLTEYQGKPLDPVKVVRVHTARTEKTVALNHADRAPEPKRQYLNPEDVADLDEMSTAKTVTDAVEAAYKQKFPGISDKRVTSMDYALGTWMGLIGGVVDKGGRFDMTEKLLANPLTKGWFSGFKSNWSKWKSNAEMTSDDAASLSASLNSLRTFVLQDCDIICTTLNLAGDQMFHKAKLNMDLVIIDEASRAPESDVLCVLGANPNATMILCGDRYQLKPHASSALDNSFAAQVKTSFFTRLVIMGATSHTLDEQLRFSSPVAAVVSLFYTGSSAFHSRKPNPVDSSAEAKVLKNWIMKDFHMKRLAFNVTVDNATCSRVANNPSKLNEKLFVATMLVLSLAIKAQIPPSWIGILSPYKSQVLLYRRGLAQLKKSCPDYDVDEILIGTFDSLQGGQRKLVIADLAVDSELGFLTESNRPNSGLSRAQICLICVGSSDMEKSAQWEKVSLRRVNDHFTKKDAVYNMKQVDIEPVKSILPSTLTELDLAIAATSEEEVYPDTSQPDGSWENSAPQDMNPTVVEEAWKPDTVPSEDPNAGLSSTERAVLVNAEKIAGELLAKTEDKGFSDAEKSERLAAINEYASQKARACLELQTNAAWMELKRKVNGTLQDTQDHDDVGVQELPPYEERSLEAVSTKSSLPESAGNPSLSLICGVWACAESIFHQYGVDIRSEYEIATLRDAIIAADPLTPFGYFGQDDGKWKYIIPGSEQSYFDLTQIAKMVETAFDMNLIVIQNNANEPGTYARWGVQDTPDRLRKLLYIRHKPGHWEGMRPTTPPSSTHQPKPVPIEPVATEPIPAKPTETKPEQETGKQTKTKRRQRVRGKKKSKTAVSGPPLPAAGDPPYIESDISDPDEDAKADYQMEKW